jgi:hypothetical protein
VIVLLDENHLAQPAIDQNAKDVAKFVRLLPDIVRYTITTNCKFGEATSESIAQMMTLKWLAKFALHIQKCVIPNANESLSKVRRSLI